MAGFDDLIPRAMPYLATETIPGSQGSDWQWDYLVTDDNGDLVDMTTGFTGVCELRAVLGGPVAIAPTVSFPASGTVRCSAANADTASVTPRRYLHEVEVTRTSDGKKIKLVGAGGSTFLVHGEVTI